MGVLRLLHNVIIFVTIQPILPSYLSVSAPKSSAEVIAAL